MIKEWKLNNFKSIDKEKDFEFRQYRRKNQWE